MREAGIVSLNCRRCHGQNHGPSELTSIPHQTSINSTVTCLRFDVCNGHGAIEAMQPAMTVDGVTL
jgi:hypothetical protein